MSGQHFSYGSFVNLYFPTLTPYSVGACTYLILPPSKRKQMGVHSILQNSLGEGYPAAAVPWVALCEQAQVWRPGELGRVADVVTCAGEARAGAGGDSRDGSCEPGGPGQLPAALGAGEAAAEEGWSLGKVHRGPSGNSRQIHSRGQGCRRTPAGHCRRAGGCGALKEGSGKAQRWGKQGWAPSLLAVIPLLCLSESSSTKKIPPPTKTCPAKDPTVLLAFPVVPNRKFTLNYPIRYLISSCVLLCHCCLLLGGCSALEVRHPTGTGVISAFYRRA